jgi:hypothetical protein
MVASFEHSLLREQRLADGRVVEIPNVATVELVEPFVQTEAKSIEQFVETEAKVALRGAAAAAHKIGLDRDVEFAAHLAEPVLEHAGAFLEAPVEELSRDYHLVAEELSREQQALERALHVAAESASEALEAFRGGATAAAGAAVAAGRGRQDGQRGSFHRRVIQLLKTYGSRRRARLGSGTRDVKNKPTPRATATRPRARAGAQSSRARTRIATTTSQTHARSGPSSGTRCATAAAGEGASSCWCAGVPRTMMHASPTAKRSSAASTTASSRR